MTTDVEVHGGGADHPSRDRTSAAAGGGVEPAARSAGARAASRDVELDFLRGVAMFFVVVNHITLPSAYRLVTVERIGPVTGAEIFVLLSGVVLGLVYRARLARTGWRPVVERLLRRALKLYVVSVAVVASVYALARIPGVDGSVLTTWTDERTGRRYDLYPGDGLDFLGNLLTLEAGPAQFNVMGLYVVMLLTAPVLLWLMTRRLTLVVLALSWALYVFHSLAPADLLPSQSENAFPVLAWQLLFVNGAVVGFHRDAVLRFMRTRSGRVVLGVAGFGFALFVFYAWNSPWAYVPDEARLGLIPEGTYDEIYGRLFERRALGVGRLAALACAVVVLYALLVRFRGRVGPALGWFFVPLGAATLYVFIIHVYFVLAVAQVPDVADRGPVVATLVHTVVLLAIWAMVKKRFLFGLIPR
jgi:hypothetical protein